MQAYKWETVPVEQLNENIKRRIIVGTYEMLVRWEFARGAVASRHSHPHEQIVVMVHGKLRLIVGDAEAILGQDDVVVIPPLRDRKEDIFALVRHFLAAAGRSEVAVTTQLMVALCHHHWPETVRELASALKHATSGADGGIRSFSVAGFSRPEAAPEIRVVAVTKMAAEWINRLDFIGGMWIPH